MHWRAHLICCNVTQIATDALGDSRERDGRYREFEQVRYKIKVKEARWSLQAPKDILTHCHCQFSAICIDDIVQIYIAE